MAMKAHRDFGESKQSHRDTLEKKQVPALSLSSRSLLRKYSPGQLHHAESLLATCYQALFRHICWMSTATLTAPPEVPVDSDSLFQALLDRLEFAKAAEEWSRCVSNLSS